MEYLYILSHITKQKIKLLGSKKDLSRKELLVRAKLMKIYYELNKSIREKSNDFIENGDFQTDFNDKNKKSQKSSSKSFNDKLITKN